PIVVLILGVHYVGPVAERAHETDWKPVAGGNAEAGLILYVVGQVRQRVTLRLAAFVGDGFVSAGERHRLEAEEADLLWIVQGELDDSSYLLVVDAVDKSDDGNDFAAGAMQVVDGFQFYVEQVAHG